MVEIEFTTTGSLILVTGLAVLVVVVLILVRWAVVHRGLVTVQILKKLIVVKADFRDSDSD